MSLKFIIRICLKKSLFLVWVTVVTTHTCQQEYPKSRLMNIFSIFATILIFIHIFRNHTLNIIAIVIIHRQLHLDSAVCRGLAKICNSSNFEQLVDDDHNHDQKPNWISYGFSDVSNTLLKSIRADIYDQAAFSCYLCPQKYKNVKGSSKEFSSNRQSKQYTSMNVRCCLWASWMWEIFVSF